MKVEIIEMTMTVYLEGEKNGGIEANHRILDHIL